MRDAALTRGIGGQAIRDLMLESVEYRFRSKGATTHHSVLSDNGSCYTARGTGTFGYKQGLDIRANTIYSSESKRLAEACVKTSKRDYAWFGDLRDAKAVISQPRHRTSW